MNSKKFRVKRWTTLLAFSFLSLALAGCDNLLDVPEPKKPFKPRMTLFGQVIDADTEKGINDAAVSIVVNGETKTAITSAARGEDGGFIFRGLPTTVLGQMDVVGPKKYLPIIFQLEPVILGGAGHISVDLGEFELHEGVEITVYVVYGTDNNNNTVTGEDSGEFVVPANGAPLVITTATSDGSGVSIETAATQDDANDSNKYTIVVPQHDDTAISVANADTDGDGFWDTEATSSSITEFEKAQGATQIIAVSKMDGPGITVVATNLNDENASSTKFMGKSGAIWIYFNQPITVGDFTIPGDAVGLSVRDDLKALGESGVDDPPDEEDVTGVTVSDPDLGNTRLIITPGSDLIENETYTIIGVVRGYAKVDVSGSSDVFEEYDLTQLIPRVTYTGTDGIGSGSENITVDNGNDCSAGADMDDTTLYDDVTLSSTLCDNGGTSQAVRLIFPEPVWGDYEVISHTFTSIDTTVDPVTTDIGQSGSFRCTGMDFYVAQNTQTTTNDNNSTQGYARSGVGCQVNTDDDGFNMFGNVSSGDTDADDGTRSFLIYLDIYDADGNQFTSEASYAVQ